MKKDNGKTEDDGLSPQVDILQYVEAPDELVNYYLSQSRAAGMVYSTVIKQLISQLYRDHDYVLRRREEKRATGYDMAKQRDMQALAWLIQAAQKYLPLEVRQAEPPPLPPKPRKRKTKIK